MSSIWLKVIRKIARLLEKVAIWQEWIAPELALSERTVNMRWQNCDELLVLASECKIDNHMA